MNPATQLSFASLLLGALAVSACGGVQNDAQGSDTAAMGSASASASARSWRVPVPPADGPKLMSTTLTTVVYEGPDRSSSKIGYLRVGSTVARAQSPFSQDGCPGGWYPVRPAGFVCVGDEATLDLQNPIGRALGKRPDLSKPLPYRYAFVRAVAPNYLKVPNKAEQQQYEFKLDKHLKAYSKLKDDWNTLTLGANDVPLDAQGVAIGQLPAQPPVLTENALYGGTENEAVPWWLEGGRKIPHLSGYKAPDYAVIAGRVRRHTGLALIDAFDPGEPGDHRRMAVTTDGRLVPASKLKPNVGSVWHGIPLGARTNLSLPIGFITESKGAQVYELEDKETVKKGVMPWRATLSLSGRSRTRQDVRYVQLKDGGWIRSDEIAVAPLPSTLPAYATGTQKWIDINLVSQTLVAYEGNRPVYVTMVSTGRDGLGDPKTTHSTIRGTFRIREKHVTTTMDSQEVDRAFELRDVPWVQYFEAGYALHASYWHDDYGKPRSHGCVNMSPIDAHWLFFWTGPALPEGWHAVYANKATTGEGTIVNIHP